MDIKNIPKYLQSVVPYIVLLEQYCVDLKMTKNELALSFVNSIVKDGILLFGCDNLKQAKENINIFNNIKILDEESILKIYNSFKNISEAIYNPAKW
jgi:aryl-alcohol dehydrogenase-like predicted oxidoreductase